MLIDFIGEDITGENIEALIMELHEITGNLHYFVPHAVTYRGEPKSYYITDGKGFFKGFATYEEYVEYMLGEEQLEEVLDLFNQVRKKGDV